jgi:formiminotetrahydrofolate cyclodeaminase
MTDSKGLTARTLAEFSELLAARTPVPGSGCAAAAIGALGTALASMALRVGRGEDPAAVVALERLRTQLLEAVEADARAYGAFRAAQTRGADLAPARRESIEVPAGIAAASLAALEHLHQGVGGIRPSLQAETLTATRALLAAIEGASFTALANHPDPETRSGLAALRERGRALACELENHLHASTPSA